jgi:hypothetical protein
MKKIYEKPAVEIHELEIQSACMAITSAGYSDAEAIKDEEVYSDDRRKWGSLW